MDSFLMRTLYWRRRDEGVKVTQCNDQTHDLLPDGAHSRVSVV